MPDPRRRAAARAAPAAGATDGRLCQRHLLRAADRADDVSRPRSAVRGSEPAPRPRHHRAFRGTNRVAFEAACLLVLLIVRESSVLRLGTVAIDGTRLDANASKIHSVRYVRAVGWRVGLAADIAALTAPAEVADAEAQPGPQAPPAGIARSEATTGWTRPRPLDARLLARPVGRCRSSAAAVSTRGGRRGCAVGVVPRTAARARWDVPGDPPTRRGAARALHQPTSRPPHLGDDAALARSGAPQGRRHRAVAPRHQHGG